MCRSATFPQVTDQGTAEVANICNYSEIQRSDKLRNIDQQRLAQFTDARFARDMAPPSCDFMLGKLRVDSLGVGDGKKWERSGVAKTS